MSLTSINVNNSTVIDVDNEPNIESENLVKSGGVHNYFIDSRPCFKNAKIIKDVNYGYVYGNYTLVSDTGYYAVLIPMYAINDWDGELYFVDKSGTLLNELINGVNNDVLAYNLSTNIGVTISCHYRKSINSKITDYEYVALVFNNYIDYRNLIYASPTRIDGEDYFKSDFIPSSISKMFRSGNMCHGVTSGIRDYGNDYTLFITTGSITHPIKIDKTKNIFIVGSNDISVVRAFSMYGAPIKLLTVTSGVVNIVNDSDILNYDGDVYIKVSSTSNNAKFYVSQDETVEQILEHGILDYYYEKENVKTYNLIKLSDYLRDTMIHNSGYVQTGLTGYLSTDFIDLGTDCVHKIISCSYSYERILFYSSNQSTLILVDSSYYWEYPVPDDTRFARIVWKTNEASGDGTLSVNQDTLIAKNVVCLGGSAKLTPYMNYAEELLSYHTLQLWRTIRANSLKNGFSDKIIDSLGDSITEQRQYQKYVARYFGCSYDIHGIGSTQVAGNGTNAYWNDSRINSLNPKADYITIMGGVNDTSSGYSVGDINTTNFNINTFVGALNTVITKIWHRYKMLENAAYTGVDQVDTVRDVKIILMTPTFFGGDETRLAKLREYANAIIEVGKLWNIPVCDVFYLSNIGVQTLNLYFYESDTTHPNELGHQQIAALLIQTLKSIEPYYL